MFENREKPFVVGIGQWCLEIVTSQIGSILRGGQNVSQILVATRCDAAIKIGWRGDLEEIVQIDLVDIVALLLRQVELVGHLVRQIPGKGTRRLIIKSKGGSAADESKHQREQEFLHGI